MNVFRGVDKNELNVNLIKYKRDRDNNWLLWLSYFKLSIWNVGIMLGECVVIFCVWDLNIIVIKWYNLL